MVVIATQNAGKFREISALADSAGVEAKALLDYGSVPEVEEDGVSCEENAMIKAVKYSLWLKREHGIQPPVIAEDSGLFIEALLGWPGVHSARVADTADERNRLVLEKLKESTSRSAFFAAYTALAVNGYPLQTWRGIITGEIADGPAGGHGFGYDPIFLEPESGQTFAQLPLKRKNEISHRTRAWQQALEFVARQKF